MQERERGYVKLYRQIMSSAVFANAELLKLFILCLCHANHKEAWVQLDGVAEPVRVRTGQFITGGASLYRSYYQRKNGQAKSPRTLWRWLKLLEKMQMVTVTSSEHHSIVTVCNWEHYQQYDGANDKQDVTHVSSTCHTHVTHVSTNNNDKNEKNDKEQQTSSVCCDSNSALAQRAERHTAHALQVSRDGGRVWERSVVFKIMQELCRTHRSDEIAWAIEHLGPYAKTPGLIRDAVLKKPAVAEIQAKQKRAAAARIERQRHEAEIRAKALPLEEFRRRIRQTREMLARRCGKEI